jgi:hypothetical protein
MALRRSALSTARTGDVVIWRLVLSEGDDPGRVRQLVAAVVVIMVLIAAGLWLAGALRSTGQIQDCVASGRTNCAPVR